MNLAFNSKHPFVPNPNKDINASRWIASLSNGLTVFEDVTPFEESAWIRLRKYISQHNLKITNLRLEAFDKRIVLVPYYGPNNEPQVNGYWYSQRSGKLIANNLSQDFFWKGIGYIKGPNIYITWVDSTGNISNEIKEFDEKNLACIINNMP